LAYRSNRKWDGRVAKLARALRRGDMATLWSWQARAAAGGYHGFSADLVYLKAADRAFPGHLADHFGKSPTQRLDVST
jgi:hypothetical protein